jgi:hypothetical protein
MDPVLVAGGRMATHILKPIHLPGTAFAVPSDRRPAHHPSDPEMAQFKHHAEHRHHIPKPRYRVTNWAAYDAALKQRGSLTVWFTDAAVQAWQAESRTTPGGQPRYSALAITTALTLRTVFGLALRQTEGLIGSVIGLLGLDLAVPDHSHAESAGEDAGGTSTPAGRDRPVAFAGGQHWPEAWWSRRMAG